MRVPEAVPQLESQPEEIDLIHHQKSINHKALETLAMATTPATTAVHQVNLLALSYYRREGTTSLPLETRYRTPLRETTLCSLVNWKKRTLCLSTLTHLHVNPKGTTRSSLQSLFVQTTMEAPATWTLVLFQQAIDRQDRTTD